jgi:secondary thiamine-phosphate synthase enzyme
MMFRTVLEMDTKKDTYTDVTDAINDALNGCIVKEGLCHIYLVATTAAITINENDGFLARDFMQLAKAIADEGKLYAHPDNAHSHLRSSVFGIEKTIPVANGRLVLGTWQRLILWEFDTVNRKRKIVISVSGD